MNIAKISEGKFYLLPSGDLVRAVSLFPKTNRLVIYSYRDFENDQMEIDMAEKILRPVWRIGEVARMVDRKVDTLRRYERAGYLSKPPIYFLDPMGKKQMRVYDTKAIVEVVEFFERRKPNGRPSKGNKRSYVDKKTIMRFMSARYKKLDIRL